MKTVKPKQIKNTTKTRTKCLLDSVYNRIGANLQEAKESRELAVSHISKEKKKSHSLSIPPERKLDQSLW